MQIRIPDLEQKKFTKPREGRMFGNIWATKNMDFTTSKGKICMGLRSWRVTDSGDDADFEVPVAFVKTNASTATLWWTLVQANASSVSDGLLFKTSGSDPDAAYTQDATANSPTDCVDDMKVFGVVTANGYDRLIVARDTDLAMLNNGTWDASWWDTTLAQAALSATNPHPMHQFLNLLLIADGNVIHVIDDSLVVVVSRITLPKEYQIIWIEDDGLRVYFGTKNLKGDDGLVFPWDGTSEKYDEPIKIGFSASLAGATTPNGVLHTVTGLGQLMAYNGQAFDEVAHFPLKTDNPVIWDITLTNNRNTVLHHNGMAIVEGKINILINAGLSAVDSYVMENCLSGIWEYDEDIGLYLKHTLGAFDGTTEDDWGAGIIAVSGALRETERNNGFILAGASVYTDAASTQLKGIFALSDSKSNKGYFITSEMSGSDFRAFWKRLKIKFSKTSLATATIVAKYMIVNNEDLDSRNVQKNATITWTSTTTFTTTETYFSNAAVGDEVEILCGKGAGSLAHISVISFATPTYTVTIDEAIKLLSCIEEGWPMTDIEKYMEAVRLGIEALKRVSLTRRATISACDLPLPGETLAG